MIRWAHRNAAHVSSFVRLLIDDGGQLVLSKGHFLYTDAWLRVAASKKLGMCVSSGCERKQCGEKRAVQTTKKLG